jgi:hypothetical protein
LNNNNRGSNRRRGRGNNRQQGGNQGNRIDSRARGNAPQLLEKYKKLAHDASLNGDRVQSEYYLQFADHYFRVVADSRAVKDEQRPRYQGDRDQPYDEEFREEDEQYRAPRENGRDGNRDSRRERPNDGRREQAERESDDRGAADEERGEFEPVENPFVRESRARRQDGERPSRARRGSANGREPAKEQAAEGKQEDEGLRFDPTSLPPSLSAAEEEAPKPRRTRARKPRAGGNEKGGEELEIAS